MGSHGRTVLLDCTLRDGGYYNDWDFSTALIQDYLYAMAFARVDVVELGFRRRPANRYLGPTAYTSDAVVDMFDVPDVLRLAVMVDAKELLSDDAAAVVDVLFRPAERSRIDLVRIAAHHREVAGLAPAIDRLRQLGYAVGLNLMQVSERTAAELHEFGHRAHTWGVEVAYIADSFGSLRPADVERIVHDLRSTFDGPLGCHMHDNMGMALANTSAAIDGGASWVDGTLLGMGRGPGNAKTEYLAIDLARAGRSEVDHVPLLKLVTTQFAELQRRYGWGSNIYYFLSAAYRVHPTYVHEMMRDGRYSIDEIVMALTQLQGGAGHAFTPERLTTAMTPATVTTPADGPDISGWCRDREVLIVGAGPSASSRRGDIERYVRDRRPAVIALNVEPPISDELVEAYVLCHPIRALIDADPACKLGRPVFAPRNVRKLIDPPPHVDVREFGLTVAPDTFVVNGTGCAVPRFEAAAYALGIAAAGGADRILLSGFDGFSPTDTRQLAMVDIFERFAEVPGAPPVIALTPTSYPVGQSSLFAEL